jgi:hypothetical protein
MKTIDQENMIAKALNYEIIGRKIHLLMKVFFKKKLVLF